LCKLPGGFNLDQNFKQHGIVVDVLETEPPDGSSPLMAEIPNLILTPHIAWASRTARQRLLNQLVDIIRDYQAGSIRNRIV